jgi:hypothetical protein
MDDMQRWWIFPIILLTISCAMGSNPAEEKSRLNTQRDYAAIVNGEKITIPEFEQALSAAKQNLLKQSDIDFTSEEGKFILATTQRSILEDMINQRLIKQQAAHLKIIVSNKDIEQEIQKLKKSFPSEKLFKETLVQENIDEQDLHQGIHDRLIAEKIKAIVAKDVEVSDREVSNFIKQTTVLFKEQEEVVSENAVSDNYIMTPQENAQSVEEAKKYLITKKQNEVYERWFGKLKKSSKIEINPDIDDMPVPEEQNFQQEGVPQHGNISGINGV